MLARIVSIQSRLHQSEQSNISVVLCRLYRACVRRCLWSQAMIALFHELYMVCDILFWYKMRYANYEALAGGGGVFAPCSLKKKIDPFSPAPWFVFPQLDERFRLLLPKSP